MSLSLKTDLIKVDVKISFRGTTICIRGPCFQNIGKLLLCKGFYKRELFLSVSYLISIVLIFYFTRLTEQDIGSKFPKSPNQVMGRSLWNEKELDRRFGFLIYIERCLMSYESCIG